MTRKGKFALAGLVAAGVGLAAAGAVAQRSHFWDGHKGRHFGGGGMMSLAFGGPNFRMCRGESGEMADHMLVRVEHRVKPTGEQQAAFDEFKTATRAAAAKLHEACPERTGTDERGKRTPIDRLARTQAGLEASLEALKIFRPAAEKFYTALNDEQKSKLERRGRGGEGKWQRRWRDRDEDTPDNAPGNEQVPAPAPEQKG
ncbi:MAG: Spy/CpxP family protein refolding chaperone [Hyphomicrobium sp.]|uniref:Spy/CpxP family protein refolding chaperone n=1 Tax=Hyphomicrobium sp. TaxID=82 RepID=UPI003D0E969B